MRCPDCACPFVAYHYCEASNGTFLRTRGAEMCFLDSVRLVRRGPSLWLRYSDAEMILTDNAVHHYGQPVNTATINL